MHLSAVETFLAALPHKCLCFALLPLIGRTANPAALDNLWCSLPSLMLLPQQRHTVQAPGIVSVFTHAHFAVACNCVPQIPLLHARIGPSPRPSLCLLWEGLGMRLHFSIQWYSQVVKMHCLQRTAESSQFLHYLLARLQSSCCTHCSFFLNVMTSICF